MNKFPELLCNFIDETTGEALQNEVKHFQKLTKNMDEIISEYRDKSLEILDQDSLKGFLFASYNSSIKIKGILEEYIKISNWDTYTEELKNFNQKAFGLFNLAIEKDPEKNGNIEKYSKPLQSGSKELLKTILRKKTVNEKVIECYLYYILIYNTYQDHLYKLEKFEKLRNALLLSLRKNSSVIDENIATLSQNKFDLAVLKSKFNLSCK